MSSSSSLRLAFVLEAIDKATATVSKVNARIDKLTEPARRVRAAFNSLIHESRFDRIGSAVDLVGQRFDGLRARVGELFGVVARGVAAVGVAGFGFKRVADEVDHLNDTAKMLGITTQELQRMGYAAQLSGSTVEELGDGLRFLSRNMIEARNGSAEMVQWFNRVGVSQERMRKMSVTQVFEAIADKFEKVGDAGQNGAKKIAVMQSLLGRSGSQLKQVLDLGSKGLKTFYEEADRLGVVLDERAVNSMADFNDAWDRLRMTVFGATANALSVMAPTLGKVVERITAWTSANRGLLATRFEEWVEQVSARLPEFTDGVDRVSTMLGRMFGAANKVAQLLGGWPNLFAVIAGAIGVRLLVSVGQLTVAMWGLSAAMIANPIGAIVVAVAALVAMLPLLVMHWDKVARKLREIDEMTPAWLRNTSLLHWGLVASGDGPNQHAAGAGRGTVNPPTLLGPRRTATEVGGSLKITIDSNGQGRVSELKKTPWSPMDLDVSFLGGPLALPN